MTSPEQAEPRLTPCCAIYLDAFKAAGQWGEPLVVSKRRHRDTYRCECGDQLRMERTWRSWRWGRVWPGVENQ